MAKAESHLGHQHGSKPVTASDKKMSKRHLAHRAEIEEMKKDGQPSEKILKKSMKYNAAHAKEHLKAMKKAAKTLKHSGHVTSNQFDWRKLLE